MHREGLGKSLPVWSLSSLMSIIKDTLSAGCKVYTQSCPIKDALGADIVMSYNLPDTINMLIYRYH